MLCASTMLPLLHSSIGRTALRIIVASACCCGIWSSLNLARAGYLFQRDDEESVRSAIHLEPDGWQYYMRLAELDRAEAPELLIKSLRLNRYDAQADIELGLRYEAEGDFAHAEKQLLEAYDVDHTYLPRWSLANYYFRRDDMSAFWTWARNAAAMPADDVGPLFELCWRVSPDPGKIAEAILNDKPELIRQYIRFLLAKEQSGAAGAVAPRLIGASTPDPDRALMFDVINRLVGAGEASAANTLWRLMMEKNWIVADATVPNNPSFLREPLEVSFDWSLPEYEGLHSWPGSSGLETEFTGSEPEDCTIAEQAVALAPGKYALAFAYRTTDIAPGTGIRWQLVDAKSNAVLAESGDLSSDALVHSAFGFTVPASTSILRQRLVYRRTLGTTRISGMLNMQSVQITTLPRP